MLQIAQTAGPYVDQVKANPVLLGILIIIGVLTAFLFFWGVFRSAIKVAILGAVLSVGAWYWYFNVR